MVVDNTWVTDIMSIQQLLVHHVTVTTNITVWYTIYYEKTSLHGVAGVSIQRRYMNFFFQQKRNLGLTVLWNVFGE